MKTYTATLTTTQIQTVTVEVPDDMDLENVEIAICEAASLSDGEFSNDVSDLQRVRVDESLIPRPR